MSFILEAIRRSDEARHKRLVPRVSTIHAATPARVRSRSRRLLAATAAAAVLALVAVAGLRSWPWPTGEERLLVDALPATPAPVTPPPAADRPAPSPEPAPASSPPPQEDQPAPAAGTAQATAAPQPGGADGGEPKRVRRPYSSPPPRDVDAAKPRQQPRVPAAPPAGGTAGAADADGASTSAEAVAPPPVATTELVTATALRDLPTSVQRTLPSIVITLHRYAATAEARMIRVNGRVAREGDLVAGELSVAEITRGGVVFAIGEQRFYMDAFQTWQAKTGS